MKESLVFNPNAIRSRVQNCLVILKKTGRRCSYAIRAESGHVKLNTELIKSMVTLYINLKKVQWNSDITICQRSRKMISLYRNSRFNDMAVR